MPYKLDCAPSLERTPSFVGIQMGKMDDGAPILADFHIEFDRHEGSYFLLVKEYWTQPMGSSYMWFRSPYFTLPEDAYEFALWAWNRYLQTGSFSRTGLQWEDCLDEKGNPVY
jgi:hypothetical protein